MGRLRQLGVNRGQGLVVARIVVGLARLELAAFPGRRMNDGSFSMLTQLGTMPSDS